MSGERVVIVGFGLAGSAFHAPLIRYTPGLELAAVVTRDAERAAKARATYPGAEVLPDLDAVLARASDFSLLVVATPNRTHVPFARAALAAGLHVVVDKPLAPTAAEGRALVEEARRAQRLLTVYQNRRWDGDFLTVRDLLERGALGTPWRFESRFERWRTSPAAGWKGAPAPEDANGLLYDLGSHLVDQALRLFGPVASVYAEMDRRRPGAVVDDDTHVALTHASGVRSHLHVSTIVAVPAERFRVMGSEGTFAKHGLDVQESALRAGGTPAAPRWGEEPEAHWGRLSRGDDVTVVPTKAGAYQRFYEGVAAAIREGAPVPVDPLDAVAGLEVIAAAQRSAREGTVVAM